MWKLTSPKGRLAINVAQGPDGGLIYNVIKEGKTVIEDSVMGIATDIGVFTEGLSLTKLETASIDESYSLPAGKKAVYHNHAEEMTLHFEQGGLPFILRVRAYDEGAAFRYEIPASGSEKINVHYETTAFRFPASFDRLWLQDLVNSYEGPYNPHGWDNTLDDQHYGMPSLFYASADGCWALVNEANVLNTNGSYCSCHLQGAGERTMSIAFAPEENGQPIESPLPFQSPWRYVVVEDSLDALINTTMNYNLNPPSVIDDTSWIKPGRALWAWWEYENGAQLYSESKSYIDFAAAMGFEAVTLDCGWDANWVKDICEYAHRKGVQLWIWTGMQRINTPEKAQSLIPLWAGWGVDGLKVDFFENDSRHTMWQYQMIAELMTEYKLMINFHGSTKPMGEGRTWPNFMTAEGIMGLEHYKWSDMPDSAHNCTVPFIRNAAGPMDYTPTGFSNGNRNTTQGHQLALPVVFESGVTHYSLSLYYMEAWNGTRFLRRCLPKYDGVKLLSGYPGDHAAILRYTSDEWLIGVITVKKRVLSLRLDFLPEGTYEAELYEDDAKGNAITMRRITVESGGRLDLPLLTVGGAGVYIAKELREPKNGQCSGYMSEDFTEYPALSAKLSGGSEPMRWNPGTEGLLLNGSAEFTCAIWAAKRYSIRFFYTAREAWELVLSDGKAAVRAVMPASKSETTFITHEIVMPLEEGERKLTLTRLSGAIPAILKMRIIDNDPPEIIEIGAEHAILTNGAELIGAENGAYEAVGLGYGAEMLFENIQLSRRAKYILRIDYCGGESRDISIEANGTETVHTYLHSTSGWGFPVWSNPEGKEVLLTLREGVNTIRLYNEKGSMSHIRGISLCLDSETPN